MPDASKSTSTSGDAPVRESAASRWPDEVWTTLLEELNYAGLRTMERVSKKMKALVESDKFDLTLFRVKPTKKKLTPLNKLTIHPMLDAVDCVDITTTEARIFSFLDDNEDEDGEKGEGVDSGPKTFNAYDYPACDEFATQPPCTQMLVTVHAGGKPLQVTDRNGVKNRRIFKALGMFWQKKAPPHLVQQAVEYSGVKAEDAKMVHCLGDHRFFEGWQSATVRNDGTVDLEANWFGS
ncbi:hypothetical protein JCM6882_005835 [Rhodosporidiobolus microsporus]